MDDALRVRVVHGRAGLLHDPLGVGQGQRAAFVQKIAGGLAVHVLEDQVDVSGVLHDGVDVRDVGMVQGRHGARLGQEAPALLRVVADLVAHLLDGHAPGQGVVRGLVDDPHASGRDLAQDGIAVPEAVGPLGRLLGGAPADHAADGAVDGLAPARGEDVQHPQPDQAAAHKDHDDELDEALVAAPRLRRRGGFALLDAHVREQEEEVGVLGRLQGFLISRLEALVDLGRLMEGFDGPLAVPEAGQGEGPVVEGVGVGGVALQAVVGVGQSVLVPAGLGEGPGAGLQGRVVAGDEPEGEAGVVDGVAVLAELVLRDGPAVVGLGVAAVEAHGLREEALGLAVVAHGHGRHALLGDRGGLLDRGRRGRGLALERGRDLLGGHGRRAPGHLGEGGRPGVGGHGEGAALGAGVEHVGKIDRGTAAFGELEQGERPFVRRIDLQGLAGGLGGFVLPILFGVLMDLTGIRSSAFMLMYGVVWVSLIWMYWTEVRAKEYLAHKSPPELHAQIISN